MGIYSQVVICTVIVDSHSQVIELGLMIPRVRFGFSPLRRQVLLAGAPPQKDEHAGNDSGKK